MLKAIIVILFLAMVASLTSAFSFLLKDNKEPDSKRLRRSLAIRVTLAGTLLAVIVYGVATGQLGNTAPWGDHRNQAPSEENQ